MLAVTSLERCCVWAQVKEILRNSYGLHCVLRIQGDGMPDDVTKPLQTRTKEKQQ